MNEFTKGPWSSVLAHIKGSDKDVCVLRMFDMSPEEFNANARLIAAAPEMYELIKGIVCEALDPDLEDNCQDILNKIEGGE